MSPKPQKETEQSTGPIRTEAIQEVILSKVKQAYPGGTRQPKVMKLIRTLIEEINPGEAPYENADVVGELIVTSLKAVEAQIGRGDIKLLSRAMRELRYAFKIFKHYRGIRKVTIFGSARTAPTDPDYIMARNFSKRLIENGYMIITGAGPGIMEAGNEGAGPSRSFGVNIRLPFEQYPNKFIANQPTYIDCRYFFTRKLVFVKEAAAVAYFPGGFGTLDEAFEVLTLVQTGKCDPIPIVFVDTPGRVFWKDLDRFVRLRLLKYRKVSKEDLNLYRITSSVEKATEEIFRFYSNYHSMRFVGDRLVLRLQNAVDADQLRYINANFKDILKSGQFTRGTALPEEANQPSLQFMPRLIFQFNRVNNGRLRQLIDFLNQG